MDETDEKPESGPVAWFKRLDLREQLLFPLVVAIVGGVAVALLTGGDGDKTTVVTGGTRHAAVSSSPPKDVVEQIRRRDIWTEDPQVFRSAKDVSDSAASEVGITVDPYTLAPTVVTPAELAAHGVDYDGRTVVLVGRVVDSVSVTQPEDEYGYRFGVGVETRLAGTRVSGVYVGSSYANEGRGKVVFVVGQVAAVGTAKTIDGRPLRAAYFLAKTDLNAGLGETDLPPVVQQALRSEARRPLVP